MNLPPPHQPTEKYPLSQHQVIATEQASRALRRMCKHFSHRVDAHWDDHKGKITFAMGECWLEATQNSLRITCNAADYPNLEETITVIERHLPQFLPAT